MLDETEINDVYEKLDDLFKLKAKRFIKGTGLKFERLLAADDLVNKTSFYMLSMEDDVIIFNTPLQLYKAISTYCEQQTETVSKEIEELNSRKLDIYTDEVAIHYRIETLANQEYKLSKLISFLKQKVRAIEAANTKASAEETH